MGKDGAARLESAEGLPKSEKETYRIGEVAALVGLEPYVLRYWETEFPLLRPAKSAHGQRLYRREDVETILTIKRLVHEEGFTIAGARKQLEAGNGSAGGGGEPTGVARVGAEKSNAGREKLRAVRRELQDLLTLLARR
ncbi:MAG: MerR family transcriptional regulator [Terriglobia bacterium]